MNGHDFTREQNMEARMTLAAARRGLAAAINDAENGIGHLPCDDPKIMEQVRAHWRRLYDTYMNADAIIADLESGDSTPVHEGSRTVHLPAVRSFGRLERDKWLAVKNLEESAELVEACKQWLKACDPADPSGIDGQFIGVVNCLNIHGAAVGDEPDIDLDKAQADWHDHVRDQRRQAMLDELADVLQTVGNLITAFGITDEEVERAMDGCLERNRRKGRL